MTWSPPPFRSTSSIAGLKHHIQTGVDVVELTYNVMYVTKIGLGACQSSTRRNIHIMNQGKSDPADGLTASDGENTDPLLSHGVEVQNAALANDVQS